MHDCVCYAEWKRVVSVCRWCASQCLNTTQYVQLAAAAITSMTVNIDIIRSSTAIVNHTDSRTLARVQIHWRRLFIESDRITCVRQTQTLQKIQRKHGTKMPIWRITIANGKRSTNRQPNTIVKKRNKKKIRQETLRSNEKWELGPNEDNKIAQADWIFAYIVLMYIAQCRGSCEWRMVGKNWGVSHHIIYWYWRYGRHPFWYTQKHSTR